MAIFFAEPLGAKANLLAEAFALRGYLRKISKSLRRSERRLDAELLLLEDAHFIKLHHGANGRPKRDGIETVFVADEVCVGKSLKVIDAVGGPKRPRRLIFKAARGAPIFRAVDHGEMGLVDLRDTATRDRAAEASLVRDKVRLPVRAAFLVHRLRGNIVRAVELDIAMIARGQRADFVDDVHQHLRAELWQALSGDRIIGEDLLAGRHRRHESLHVAHISDTFGASDDDGLEIFRTPHRAHARPARCPVKVVNDARIKTAALPGPADGGHTGLRGLVLTFENFLRLPNGLAPDIRGIDEFGVVIVNFEVDGLWGPALEDDHVPASKLQLGAPIAAGVRTGDGARQGTLGNN